MHTDGGECTWMTCPVADRSVNLLNLERMKSLEWLGQTIASHVGFSVFVYADGNFNRDWLQLAAASSWMVSNIASILSLNRGIKMSST